MVKTETLLIGGAVVVGGYLLLRNAGGIAAATGGVGSSLLRSSEGIQQRGEIRQDERTERTENTQEGRTARNEIRQDERTERVENRQEGRTDRNEVRQEQQTERVTQRQIFFTNVQGTVIRVLSVPLDLWNEGVDRVKRALGINKGEVRLANGCFNGILYSGGVAVGNCQTATPRPNPPSPRRSPIPATTCGEDGILRNPDGTAVGNCPRPNPPSERPATTFCDNGLLRRKDRYNTIIGNC